MARKPPKGSKDRKKVEETAVAVRPPKGAEPPGDVDNALVEEALREIQKRISSVAENFNRGIVDIGHYVFEKFFGSDPKQVEFRGRKMTSFRTLADHPELPISKSWLHSAVSVAKQETLLLKAGVDEIKKVPATHQVELLQVKSLPDKKKLVHEILEKKLSVRALQASIERKQLPASPSSAEEGERDRKGPRIPKLIESILLVPLEKIVKKKKLARMTVADRKRYRGALEKAVERLTKMIEAIDAVEPAKP